MLQWLNKCSSLQYFCPLTGPYTNNNLVRINKAHIISVVRLKDKKYTQLVQKTKTSEKFHLYFGVYS